MSNQGGVDKTMDGKRAVTVRGRIDNFVRKMGVPMEALCATQRDIYRKGMGTGMWDLLASTTGHGLSTGGVAPCKEMSFFVGDAAGAPTAPAPPPRRRHMRLQQHMCVRERLRECVCA